MRDSSRNRHKKPARDFDLSQKCRKYDPVVAGTRDGSGAFIHDKAILRASQASITPQCYDSIVVSIFKYFKLTTFGVT